MNEGAGARQRLFVAVPLPENLLEFVREAQELLPKGGGLRLMRPDQLHVTLAFLGEVGQCEAASAQAVIESVAGEMGGQGTIERFLFLPSPKRARVVALDISDDAGAFAALFESVMGGLEKAGAMKRDKRPFRAHLTVARLRDAGPVQPRSDCGRAPFAIESVCLYRSELRREGAVYTVLARKMLERKEAQE